MRVVVFSEHNARILKNPKPEDYKDSASFIENPVLSHLTSRGIPPHHWKLENGKVVEMDAVEKNIRNKYHEEWHKKLLSNAYNPQHMYTPAELSEKLFKKQTYKYFPWFIGVLLVELILRRIFHV